MNKLIDLSELKARLLQSAGDAVTTHCNFVFHLNKPEALELAELISAKEGAQEIRTLNAQVEELRRERDEAKQALRVVQNAAKAIASAHGTELEHLRQNHTFDHRLRAEHESLQERDALMTELLEAAEARATKAEAGIAEAVEVCERCDSALCGFLGTQTASTYSDGLSAVSAARVFVEKHKCR